MRSIETPFRPLKERIDRKRRAPPLTSIVGAHYAVMRRLVCHLIGRVQVNQLQRSQLVLHHRHLIDSLREESHPLTGAHYYVDLKPTQMSGNQRIGVKSEKV